MDLVSVVMPVYNTCEYVARAIESVQNQSYNNWELIIVDDGSTDSSLKLCRTYELLDDRIIVYHKSNGGQGSARNYALNRISGDYVMFLDSDDWLDEDAIQFLLSNIKIHNADVLECGYRSVSANGEVEQFLIEPTKIMTALECLNHLGKDHSVGPQACFKLFNVNAVKDKRFPEIRAYEDYQYIFDVCTDVSKFVHMYEPKWSYFHRSNSTMTSPFSLKNIALIDAQNGICEILKRKGFINHYNEAKKSLCSIQFYILYKLMNAREIDTASVEVLKLRQTILNSYADYMANPVMGINKLMLIIFRYMPKFIWKAVLKAKFGSK